MYSEPNCTYAHLHYYIYTDSSQLNNIWNNVIDNEFPTRLFSKIDSTDVFPLPPFSSNLCSRRNTMDIWRHDFYISDELSQLQEKSSLCDLCRLFYDFAIKSGIDNQSTIQYFRVGSSFKRDLNGPPVLSIVAGPGKSRGS